VLFIMISNHYPMTYSGPNGWIALVLISLAGVLVRQFFLLTHKQKFAIALPLAALLILGAAAFLLAPHPKPAAAGAATVSFARAQTIVRERCASCHAEHPTQPGFASAPQGIMLDTPEHIAADAQRIEQQAVQTHAMPLGNVTHMTDDERAALGAWIAAGAKTQ
jgi:uncharacterized membrane protein